MNSTELTYRKTAVEGADGFGLLIALYDTLAGNLKRAAEAERRQDIEARCNEINHAILVVAHLQNWIERSDGGELSQKLIAFYSSLRRTMFEAQVKRSAELLERQMDLVLSVREMWQTMELRPAEAPEAIPPGSIEATSAAMPQAERSCGSSWSA
ncbi:MAG: flagellar export chaperone FliS [Acidobacteriaceae bacterium]